MRLFENPLPAFWKKSESLKILNIWVIFILKHSNCYWRACVFLHTLMSIFASVASQIIAPEIVKLSIERVKTNASDNIILVCKATGSLPLKFYWYKGEKVLSQETPSTASVNLIIGSNGGGSYKCLVENDAGKDSRELFITSDNIRTLKQTQNQSQSQGTSIQILDIFDK